MRVSSTALPDVLLIEPLVLEDPRGFLSEIWNDRRFRAAGLDLDFVQENHSFSLQGILRGLHYQVAQAQGKLVHVTVGRIFDVAVDLRRSSKAFGKWGGKWLTENNHHMLWIPPGFAHGFYVASETAHLHYKCTDFYSPEFERTIAWNDPRLAIDWPLMDDAAPALSEKDQAGVLFEDAEYYE